MGRGRKISTDSQDRYGTRMLSKRRIGSNSREHCLLVARASKAAKERELSSETESNPILVDGLLTDLMHMRAYDAEGIAEKENAAGPVAEMGPMRGHMEDRARTSLRMENLANLESPEMDYDVFSFTPAN